MAVAPRLFTTDVPCPKLTRRQRELEADFRVRVANILSNEPYCHEVYFHEGDHEKKFSVRKVRGYVDLYVVTNSDWEWHRTFPVIGIETAIAEKMGWVLSKIQQTHKYVEMREKAEYFIGDGRVPPPTIFLVCTDHGFDFGEVYMWNEQSRLKNSEQRRGAWVAITEMLDRLLWDVGAAVLRRDYFITNMFVPGGKRYDL